MRIKTIYLVCFGLIRVIEGVLFLKATEAVCFVFGTNGGGGEIA